MTWSEQERAEWRETRGKKPRRHESTRVVEAGCYDCQDEDDLEPLWTSRNAHGVAARHHDIYGHTTWVRTILESIYGQQT